MRKYTKLSYICSMADMKNVILVALVLLLYILGMYAGLIIYELTTLLKVRVGGYDVGTRRRAMVFWWLFVVFRTTTVMLFKLGYIKRGHDTENQESGPEGTREAGQH